MPRSAPAAAAAAAPPIENMSKFCYEPWGSPGRDGAVGLGQAHYEGWDWQTLA